MRERSVYGKVADAALCVAERIGYKRPYVIRVHHLVNLAQRPNADYRTQAARVGAGVARTDNPWYVSDVLGDNRQGQQRLEEAVKRFFEGFDDLPDDHPVKIVSGQRDGICNGCAIGQHCSTRNEIEGDMLFMVDSFRRRASQLNLLDDIIFKKERVKSSDNGTYQTTTAVTTAGVVRKIMYSR